MKLNTKYQNGGFPVANHDKGFYLKLGSSWCRSRSNELIQNANHADSVSMKGEYQDACKLYAQACRKAVAVFDEYELLLWDKV